uniref:Uncharacterized protein n=1 Tax=Grammatophora oceanica TaxID=210454 RepID=A0A7S1Y977_9STRA|mmetsp:Transcript_33609/g.49810  ORF Transcript_33609/g.49810 Transcript_33609/m.49810 type:complete len:162 (+) Transcript_33609:1-486(+)
MTRTMEHLSVAKSLAGKQEKSLKILARMLEAQIEAFGANSPQAEAAITRIRLIKSENLAKLIEAVAKRHQRQGRQQAQAGKAARTSTKKTASKRTLATSNVKPAQSKATQSEKSSAKKTESAKKAETKNQQSKKTKKSAGFKNPFKKEKKEKERKCGPGVL